MSKITDFFKLVVADLKDDAWPAGTTVATKNAYRWKVVGLMAAIAVGVGLVYPLAAIVPVGVAVWKVKIILTDK